MKGDWREPDHTEGESSWGFDVASCHFVGNPIWCDFRGIWPYLQNSLLVYDGKIPCPRSQCSSLSLPSPFHEMSFSLSDWSPSFHRLLGSCSPQRVTHASPSQASDFNSRPLLMRSPSLKYSLLDGFSPSYMVPGYFTSHTHTSSLYCTLDKVDTSCSPEAAPLSWFLSFAGNVSSTQKLSSLPSLIPKPPHSAWLSQMKPCHKRSVLHSTVVWVNLPCSFLHFLSTGVDCWIFVLLNYNSVTSFHLTYK